MSEELLTRLEEKVQNAVEMIELLKAEVAELEPLRSEVAELEPLKAQVAELTEENNALKDARSQWEEKLTNLIGKFEQLEAAGEEATVDETVDDNESNEETASDEDSSSEENSFST